MSFNRSGKWFSWLPGVLLLLLLAKVQTSIKRLVQWGGRVVGVVSKRVPPLLTIRIPKGFLDVGILRKKFVLHPSTF